MTLPYRSGLLAIFKFQFIGLEQDINGGYLPGFSKLSGRCPAVIAGETSQFSQKMASGMFFYVNSMKSNFFLIFGIDFMENLS